MGSSKEERDAIRHEKNWKIVKRCIACLASLLISIVGGLILVWWQLKFHRTNTQLWMVPFGLIVFVTPIIIGLSAFVSDISSPKQEAAAAAAAASAISTDNSVADLER